MTWDKKDIVLPGVDSSQYLSIGSEAYNIEARGATVAVTVTPLFGEMLLLKSQDNGNTWVKEVIYDFPLDKWDGAVYTDDDLPVDPNSPETLFTFSTDGSNTLVIDEQDVVHVFFNEMYLRGNPDKTFTLDLGTNGIAYWNDLTQTITTVAGAEDLDGDGTITLGGDPSTYRHGNSGATSSPCASIDADGNIYLTYMAFNELFTDGTDGKTFRHIFITKSSDGGETWSAPFDIINSNVTEVPEFVEAAFPAIPSRTSDAIQLIYQQDYVPGLTPSTATVSDQYIMHVSLDKETFEVYTPTKEADSVSEAVILSPNPAHVMTQLGFDIKESANIELGLYSLLGKQVLNKKLGWLTPGSYQFPLTLKELASGIYFVKMEVDGKLVTKKLMVD